MRFANNPKPLSSTDLLIYASFSMVLKCSQTKILQPNWKSCQSTTTLNQLW